MPRERNELTRQSNIKNAEKIFILAFEGTYAEFQYYEAIKEKAKYQEDIIYIVNLERTKEQKNNSAPKYVFDLLKKTKQDYKLKATDEFWMIIDRDRWKLDEWREKCEKEKNFFIALSNPCFEFWLLLHIKDITDFSDVELQKMYENKKVSKKKNYLEKVLKDVLAMSGGYRKDSIKPERFLAHLEKAVRQAKVLDSSDIYNNLGSHNYLLIKKLFSAK
ncbi:MAG: RloB family protein [Chitinophagales bacterium]